MSSEFESKLINRLSAAEKRSPDQTADRITGRKVANELIVMAISDNPQKDFQVGFARACRAFADRVLGPVETQLRVMSEDEARKFEQTRIQFGMHLGQEIIDVPIEYLVWVADSQTNLQAYLRSPLGLRRISQE